MSPLVTPTDPIQTIIDRAHTLALKLMDEDLIIVPGMNNPNDIVKPALYFEKLESEPSPRRRIAQQHRRVSERSHKRLVTGMTTLCASLYAARRIH